MYKLLLLLLVLVSVSCKNRNTIVGTWWFEDSYKLNFESDGDFSICNISDSGETVTQTGTFSTENDNSLVFNFAKITKVEKYHFKIKDSVLTLILYEADGVAQNNNPITDTTFYHRSPKCCECQIKQLYYQGRITDYKCDTIPSFIYFQF